METSRGSAQHQFRIRLFQLSDHDRLRVILRRAFTPISEGFRHQLGDKIFSILYPDLNGKQEGFLASLIDGSPRKELHILLFAEQIIGFIGLVIDDDGAGGEIELNAVDPDYQGMGGGHFMYAFAVERMRQKGVRLLRVVTGADKNHEKARAAYHRAGFSASLSWTVFYQVL